MTNKPGGVERRRARRRPILNTFSLFVVVPKKGVHRLTIQDVSDFGIGFELDTEGEDQAAFPIAAGEKLDLRFYLNTALFLPLTVEVVRLQERDGVRYVGAEFSDKSSRGFQALQSFLTMLDAIMDVVRLDSESAAQG